MLLLLQKEAKRVSDTAIGERDAAVKKYGYENC
jgi:hypothetical protein